MNSFVRPAPPRYIVKDLGSSLEITTSVNMAKKGLMIALAIFSSIFWLAYGAFIIYMVIQDTTSSFPPMLPTIFYILPIEWLLGSVILTLGFVWGFTFKEIIVVNDKDIVVNHRSRITNHIKRYLAEYINDLRASTSYFNKPIVFDYGAKTMRFGQGLEEAEAKQIIAMIQEKFPIYSEARK